MKSADEIKKGLACCTHNSGCDACPYRDISVGCRPARNADALALIQQIEVDNSQLLNYIRLLQAERDAAVLDMEGWGRNCEICKYLDNSYGEDPCPTVEELDKRDGYCPRWQWRGVQKEDDDD